jgi:NAD(P)-dependent dehydrogenase (short-subunit alcohol dehydrogenase family)
VRALAREGAVVGVAARTLADCEALCRSLWEEGLEVWPAACDVADPASVQELAARAGPVDILVNNAGAASTAPLTRLSLEEWTRLWAVNATGTLLCMQAFLPGMLERGWGRILNIASTAALTGGRYLSAYSASKHAVMGLTRCAACEVAERGVTVNALCPGFVDHTDMTRESLARIAEKTGRSPAEARAVLVATNPQGRLIEPDEVAWAVVMLCQESARGINGQAIVLDGGGLLR